MRPDGWNRILEVVSRRDGREPGGLLYLYPDGTEYYASKAEVSASIWGSKQELPNGEGSGPGSAPQT